MIKKYDDVTCKNKHIKKSGDVRCLAALISHGAHHRLGGEQ